MRRFTSTSHKRPSVPEFSQNAVHCVACSELQLSHRAESERFRDRARLEEVACQLNLMFAYRIEAATCFARISHSEEPVLWLGESIGLQLRLEINPRTGQFVLQEGNADTPTVLITDAVERIIDLVESIASSACRALMPRTIDQAVEVLVGHPLADIESRLVMRTLRYFRGDAAQAAFALGIEETELVTLICRHLVDPMIAAHPDMEETP